MNILFFWLVECSCLYIRVDRVDFYHLFCILSKLCLCKVFLFADLDIESAPWSRGYHIPSSEFVAITSVIDESEMNILFNYLSYDVRPNHSNMSTHGSYLLVHGQDQISGYIILKKICSSLLDNKYDGCHYLETEIILDKTLP